MVDIPIENFCKVTKYLDSSDACCLQCLNKWFNAFVLEQCRVPWRILGPLDLNPYDNICITGTYTSCHCYRHPFESLEEQLDTLVQPINSRDNIYTSKCLEDMVIKFPYCSSTTGHRWLSFVSSIKMVLKGRQVPCLVSLHMTLCGWDGKTYLDKGIEEVSTLANSLLHLVWDFRLSW